MELKTKYNYGDKVWYMPDDSVLPTEGTIATISFVKVRDQDATISYGLWDKDEKHFVMVNECKIYPTKEELKQYIISKFN